MSWCPAGPAQPQLAGRRDDLRDWSLEARPRTDAELVMILSVWIRTAVADVDPQDVFAMSARQVLAPLSPTTGQKPTSPRRRRAC